MVKDKEKKKKKAQLPEHLEEAKDYVECGALMNKNVNTYTSANILRPIGYDNSWDLEEFQTDFKVVINKLDPMVMEFDLIGCDPAIANALRRILIAEIPTMAAEHIFMVDNTSIIQDEVLSHRLGMVPLMIDPGLFIEKNTEEAPNEKNTVVFKLDVTCRRENGVIINEKVMSSQLKWLPHGSEMPDETSCRFAAGQGHMFSEDEALQPRPVLPDILLAKLRPGQCIQLEAHCTKGVGKDHAKWSPVATAWYRLHPELRIVGELTEEMEAELEAAAPPVFQRGADGKLEVTSARRNEFHLEKVRGLLERPEFAKALKYLKKKDHFIFTIESTGIVAPQELFLQALDALEGKAQLLAGRLPTPTPGGQGAATCWQAVGSIYQEPFLRRSRPTPTPGGQGAATCWQAVGSIYQEPFLRRSRPTPTPGGQGAATCWQAVGSLSGRLQAPFLRSPFSGSPDPHPHLEGYSYLLAGCRLHFSGALSQALQTQAHWYRYSEDNPYDHNKSLGSIGSL
eukprot:gene8646-34096_t